MFDDLVRQAENRLRAGDLVGAYNDARCVLSQSRTNGRAHYVMSCIATLKGAHSDALQLCNVALTLDGPSAEYLGQLAICHFHLGILKEAWTAATKAWEFDNLPDGVADKLSEIFHAVADYPRFLAVALRRLAKEPANDALLVQAGSGYFLCGRIDEARIALEKAIQRNPKNARAWCGLTELRTASPGDNAVDAIAGLIGEEMDPGARIMLYHALAREHDGLGDTDAAFASLKTGKDIYLSVTGYSLQPDIDMFAAIHRYIDAAPPSPAKTSPARTIFVVGMPRSGTTVTQQVLTNCDGAVSIGESLQFGALVRTHCNSTSPRLVDAQTVDQRWPALPLDAIGETYAAYAQALAGGAERPVDKLPLNLLYVPLIVRALPNARIVCLRRHPLDTVLGNYRLLAAATPTYGYGSSLKATAAFVAESMRLAERLASCYPQQFHLLDYEEFTADPDGQGREVVQFCGLEWRDGVARIEDNVSPSGSASAAQVKAPIHRGYIGRWRKYQRHLGEAIGVLRSYGIAADGV